MVRHEVIASSSKGNAVLVNGEILIDAGVPFKSILSHVRNLKIVLLTHIHRDHFNASTVRKMASERPTLRWGVPPWLVADVVACGVDKRNVDINKMCVVMDYGNFTVQAIPLVHDVPNCGYKLHFTDGGSVFYATDTNSLEGIEAKGYSLYLVEANYTEGEITERIRRKQEEGRYCHEWDVLENHLSRERVLDWIYGNAGPHSAYVLLHGHVET